MYEVHEIIKELRERKKLSQEYLAKKLNISQPAYAQIENGKTKINIDKLERIAEILETKVEDILHLKKQENISFAYNKLSDNAVGIIQHYHATHVETMEKFITHLQSENEFLREELRKKTK